MFMKLPTVARCCCCAPLRYGILVWAYIKLVVSVIALAINLMWMFVWWRLIEEDIISMLLIIITAISIVIDVIFNFILIQGAHKKNLELLRMYHRYAIAHAVIFVLLGLFWTGIMVIGSPLDNPEVIGFIVTMAFSITIPLVMHIYLVIVLRSEMKKLECKEHIDFENPLPEAFGDTKAITQSQNEDKLKY